jgi:hypothetical protein
MRSVALGMWLGVTGALLGVVAGVIQLAAGDEIPEWTGNKMQPVQLGIVTIVLSLLALACVIHLKRRPEAPALLRGIAVLLILGAAGVCFSTVGRLWYVPGPLLIVSALLLARRP